MHDAFERGMRDPGFFEHVADTGAWLRTVAVRLAVSRLRRRALWERVRLGVPVASNELPDPELHDALRRLQPTQRGAVVLRYFFGSGYAEIALALGLSQKSVGQVLTRARAALRKELT